jgi:hypothetical protein
MTVLEQVFASGGDDMVIPTLEITSSAWAAPILLCSGFEDHRCITEDGRALVFLAAGIEVALPRRDTAGTQVLTFAIDNVSGASQRLIDDALEAGARVNLTFRHYLASDLSAPAENPLRFVVREGSMEGSVLKVNAAFFDMINTAWPRRYYSLDFAPGLRYLG